MTVPSSEITVSDTTANKENLRPSSSTPLTSSQATLKIDYTPSEERPIKEVKLVNTDNIKTFTVKFYNADDTITTKQVSFSLKETCTPPLH